MFCSKSCDNLINKAHKRALRVVYLKPDASLPNLLEIDSSPTIHVGNLRKLMCEVYKSLNKLNPDFMCELFIPKSLSTELRSNHLLSLPRHKRGEKTRSKGANTHLYRCVTVWNSLKPTLTQAKTLIEFKVGLKTWYGNGCICKICRF